MRFDSIVKPQKRAIWGSSETSKTCNLLIKSYPDAANKLRVSLVEVKSGKRYTTVSLDKLKRKFGKKVGVEYVLHPKDFGKEGNRMFAPLYMTMCL